MLPKYYATVNQVKNKADLNHSLTIIDVGDWEDYEFGGELGSGGAGTAYIGIKKSTA